MILSFSDGRNVAPCEYHVSILQTKLQTSRFCPRPPPPPQWPQIEEPLLRLNQLLVISVQRLPHLGSVQPRKKIKLEPLPVSKMIFSFTDGGNIASCEYHVSILLMKLHTTHFCPPPPQWPQIEELLLRLNQLLVISAQRLPHLCSLQPKRGTKQEQLPVSKIIFSFIDGGNTAPCEYHISILQMKLQTNHICPPPLPLPQWPQIKEPPLWLNQLLVSSVQRLPHLGSH